MNADIRDRMEGLRIEITPETAARHRATIEAELKSPSPIPARWVRRRRMPMVMLAVVALLGLTAVGAVAAETAIRGDLLYPVKQATEWVRTWIDPNVPANHRVDELERLIDRHADADAITDQLERAEDAVRDPHVDTHVVDRLEEARDRLSRDASTGDESGDRLQLPPPRDHTTTTTDTPPDGRTDSGTGDRTEGEDRYP